VSLAPGEYANEAAIEVGAIAIEKLEARLKEDTEKLARKKVRHAEAVRNFYTRPPATKPE
jgi:hypothetical protein